MAAIFPLDTTKPWTFNGVTYKYDATEDRWFVISTNKTDFVDDSLETLDQEIDVINTVIDQEIDNRTALLNQAAAKNNEQDTRLDEIDARLELIANNIGVLDFAGLFEYMPLITEDYCNEQFTECVLNAAGDAEALQVCTQEQARCMANVTTEVPDGKFTSDDHVYANVNYLRISNKTINDATYDWVSLIEPGDYIELIEQNLRDTVLYEVLTDIRADAENIRVQFVRQTNLGDSEFNDGELYAIRVFKEERGLDINSGDARYVQRPYTVMFSDDPPELGEAFTGVLKNGELWYDTQNLELFVWNNNAWVTAAKPPSQDVVVQSLQQDVDKLAEEAFTTNQTINTLISESLLENNIYYSDNAPTGDVTGTLRNGDIWIDSDDLTIKFYSGGAWINPDRQAGGNYLEKTGGEMTGKLTLGRVGNEIDGFTVQGRKQNGTVGNLLSVYHNGNNTIPDAVNYFGKVDSDNNIQTKKSVTDLIGSTLINAFTYQAANGVTSGDDWQNPVNDGKFSAGNNLSSDNHFWYFSDIDQNGNLLNLRRFSSSDKETLYIQIGHYSHTYLSDPDVNRDGMKIVWAGLVEQVNRVKTGSAGSAVFYPGWELFLNRGTGDNPIPGGTITSGGTYYIKFGGLL